MKNLFALLVSVFAITLVNAQKIEVSKDDKILVDGTEYAILKKTSKGLEHAEFSLQTLDGEEVALAKVSTDVVPSSTASRTAGIDEYYIHITFLNSGNQASMIYSLAFKKQFAKEVVKCNLFNEGKYNEGGEKKFMILNPYRANQDQTTTTVNVNVNDGGNSYQIVSRNRSAMIMVFNGEIQQDNTTIGSVTEDSGFNGGKQVKTYTFSLPDGTQVAYATVEGINTKTATIVTNKDNRTHTVALTSNFNADKEIAKYLVSKFYL